MPRAIPAAKPPKPVSAARHVRLFRNGRSQAVRIPREFELPGNEAVLRRDGSRLVIEPVPRRSLLALLASWSALEEKFPDIDEKLLRAEDVTL